MGMMLLAFQPHVLYLPTYYPTKSKQRAHFNRPLHKIRSDVTSTLKEVKGPYADHILIPQGSTGSSTFLISNESPYFSGCKSKILALNSL